MEIGCAECGCVVDAGVRVVVCGEADCCCTHLPTLDDASVQESDDPVD